MEIVEKNVADLKPYKRNPRHNEDAVDVVKASIKEFGFKVPIVIDKHDVIVTGHTRLMAAKELGMKKVPCILADDLSDEQIKAFRLADNKTAEFASWNFELLDSEIDDILDIDMTEFGFLDFEDALPEPYDKALEEEYADHGDDFLVKKRILITYTDETESRLLEMLGLKEFTKVVYDVTEL